MRVERRDLVGDSIMMSGNTACALGAIYAGATVAAWYPITPSTSVVDAFGKYAKKLRVDKETGKKNFAVVQAEDELAAIGMVIGANWNGARSFTATSGPGVSLMNEFLGLAYFAEIPTVLIDVQRTGPSTGMPTRTQQSDILEAAYASHGDTKHVLLFPASPKECFELTAESFDLAEKLQTPVIVMTDLDLGMNDHVSRPLEWDDRREYRRGKVLDAAALEKLERYGRYLDMDGDGIPYRTIPGTHESKGAFRHARHVARRIRGLHRRRRRVPAQYGQADKKMEHRQGDGSRAGILSGRKFLKIRRFVFRNFDLRGGRSHRIIKSRKNLARRDARQSVSLRQSVCGFYQRARKSFRHRTKPRRAV